MNKPGSSHMIASLQSLSTRMAKRESAMALRNMSGVHGLLRMALVAVMVAVFGIAGMVSGAEAALQYVNGTSATNVAGSATYNVSLSGLGIAEGDLVVVVTGFGGTADGNPGVTTTGYTEVFDLYANDTRDTNLSVNYKIMGATPDTQVTVNGSGNTANGAATVVHVWRGVDATTPMDVAATSATGIDVNTPDSPAITPITAGAYVLTVGGGSRNNTAVTMTTPTGYANSVSIQGNDSTISFHAGIASKAWSGSGAEDPAAWGTSSTFTSDSWAAGTLVLRPAPSDSTAPTNMGTVTITNPASGTGTYIPPAGLVFTATFDEPEVTPTCEYTSNGSTWVAGAVSGGATTWTCTASPAGPLPGGAATLNIRATSPGGTTTATALNRTVDATAPVTTAMPVAGTYGADQNVTLSATDTGGIGGGSTSYCVDTANTCTPGTTYSAPVAVTGTPGSSVTKYLRYRSTDAYGNVETIRSSQYIIDQTCNVNTAPAVSASSVTTSGATLTWNAVPNATSYKVYRGATDLGAQSSPYSDGGAAANTAYTYSVMGVGTGSCEGPAGTAIVNTLPNATGAPTFSGVGTTSLTVNWTAPSGGAASYDVYRYGLFQANVAATTYPDSGLTPNSGYSYTIVAKNAAGDAAAASPQGTETTLAVVPSAPAVGGATSASLNVTIGADANSSTTQYVIRINGGAFTNQFVQADGTVGATEVWQTATVWGTETVTGLAANTAYTFTVKARNGNAVETTYGAGAGGSTLAVNNNTAVAAVNAVGGDAEITVVADYTGDSNNNNTLRVEWGLDGVSFALGNVIVPHSASPYGYTITGLTNGTAYQVRVTFLEAGGDTVSGTNPTILTGIIPSNMLVHNSVTTGSTKWAGDGGWGLTGTKYGRFRCATCHTDTTGNIKRIREQLPRTAALDPAEVAPVTELLPGDGETIAFTDTRNTFSDFGDDSGGHATSTRICEGCHSQNKYHNYDTANNTGGLAHNNKTDCLTCHPHSAGFKAAGCDTCHGYPPPPLSNAPATGSTVVGAHAEHATAGFTCDNCHGAGSAGAGGAAHTTGTIAIAFAAFSSTSGTYNGQSSVVSGYTGAGAGAANDNLNCTAVYCHGGTIDGVAPLWNGNVLCGSCHGAGTSNAPGTGGSDNSHARHIALAGVECSTCHGAGFSKDDGTGTTGVAPAGHMDGGVTMAAAISGGTYSKASPVTTQGLTGATAYGTCSSVSCHASGTPQWGTTNTNGCTWCHNNGTADGALLNAVPAVTNAIHTTHNNANNSYVPSDCDACHGANASAGTHTGHANGSLTLGNDLTAYNSGNANCTNSCHIATATGLWDGTPPALACLDCHAATYIASGAIPATGLHNMSAAGVQKHDATITGGCAACHVTEPGTHLDGSYSADGAANGDRWVTRANMNYTQIAPASGRSGSCSGTGLSGCHSDAGNWSRLWSTEANVSDATTTVGNAKCNVCHGQWSSLAGSAGWAAGTTHAAAATRGNGHEPATPDCDTCHVYASGAARHDTATHQINVNSTGTTYARSNNTYGSGRGGCAQCHGAAGTSYDFPISYFALSLTAGTAPPMPACASCHNDAAKAAAGVPQVVIAASGSSTHVDADGPGGSTYTINVGGFTAQCENCHAGHADGTSGANDVEIPTTYGAGIPVPTMNNQYATHGNRIKLGGTATSGSTEAEMCWACHDLRTVSEWGANNNADTGSLAYNYGQLYEDAATVPGTTTSNWTTGYWRSGKGLNSTLTTNPYWYKRGKVRSTHSANYDGTTVASGSDGSNWKAGLLNNSGGYTTTYNKNETLDAVANIRCSYCHDVHGTHNGVNGDNSSTTVNTGPYLRGTWLGNPYNEDGAPRYGMAAWSTQGGGTTIANGNPDYGLVPRGSADPASSGLAGLGVGGWWIDQNSNNPVANHATTAFRTATGNAGLCDQCHGSTKDGTWTAAEIGAIDQVTGENLWVSGFNGHANSVIGGSMTETGTNLQWNNTTKVGRNIFNRTVRNNSATASYSSSSHANTDMGLATHTSGRGYSYRSSSGGSTGYGWLPRVNNTDTGTSGGEYTVYRYFAWNNTSYQTTTRNSNIATGTQILYVTMEPDATTETAHNAQANYHTFSCSKCHNPHASRLPKLMITNCLDTNHNTWEDKSTYTGSALPAPWTGIRHSNWAAAQNCHRLDSRATGTTSDVTLGSGWNKVTPWIEDTTPNGTLTGDLTTLPAY